MKKSKLGYKKNSPDKKEPSLKIDSNFITMEGVDFPIEAYPNGDKPVLMQPGLNYYFPNSTEVIEIPMRKLKKQTGGTVKPNIQKLGDIEFDSNTARQSDGYLIVKDNKTGKDFGVIRNQDGSYGWYNPKDKYSLKATEKKSYSYTEPGEREYYYDPIKWDISGKEPFTNALYKASGVLNLPIVESFAKYALLKAFRNSDGAATLNVEDLANKSNYTGGIEGEGVDLARQFVYGDQKLKKSAYKPIQDYYEFLPSYSLKNNELKLKDYNVENDFSTHLKKERPLEADSILLNWKNKKTPVYSVGYTNGATDSSPLREHDLGNYKYSMAYDEQVNLPFVSISDAWDFEPTSYSRNYKTDPDKAYQQAFIAQKLGNPFKIYDRYYFDPTTGKYIEDAKVDSIKNKKFQKGGSITPPQESTRTSIPIRNFVVPTTSNLFEPVLETQTPKAVQYFQPTHNLNLHKAVVSPLITVGKYTPVTASVAKTADVFDDLYNAELAPVVGNVLDLSGSTTPTSGATSRQKKSVAKTKALGKTLGLYDDAQTMAKGANEWLDFFQSPEVPKTNRDGGIHIDPSKRGTFKAQATRMGMSVKEAADYILANKDKYTPKMIKKANFAKNFAQDGMLVPESTAMILPVRDISVDDMLEQSLLDKTPMIQDLSSRTRMNKMFEEAGDWQPKKKMSKPKKFYEKEEGGYYEEGGPTNGDTRRSTRKGKKIDVYMDGSWHAFGDSSMQDFRQHKSEKRKKAFYARHKKNLQGDSPRAKAFRVYAKKTWEEGGKIPVVPELYNGTIEVENNETVHLPNGTLAQFKGKDHEEGGIPTNLPGGSFIFSEHLKAPKELKEALGIKSKKKLSYADLSKKYPTKGLMNFLDESTDEFRRATKEIELSRNLANLNLIAETQEAMKTKFKNGGKYQDGGPRGIIRPDGSVEYLEDSFPTVWEEDDLIIEPFDEIPLSDTFSFEKWRLPESKKTKGINKISLLNNKQPGFTIGNEDKGIGFGNQPTTDYLYNGERYDSEFSQQAPWIDGVKSRFNTAFDKTKEGIKKAAGTLKNVGIDSTLAGTIADIALVAANKLKVEGPTLYDTTKKPIFSQYKRVEPKESQKALSLAINSLNNSNLPEQVKQSKIADLTAKFLDVQGQVDSQEAQRYQQFQDQNLSKLQSYMDINVNKRYKNLDQYTREKGSILRQENKFKTWKNQQINNSIRNYFDYVDTTNKSNQLSDRNYTVNPITGKVKFKEKPESQLSSLSEQFKSQFAGNTMDLGNGLRGTVIQDPTTGQTQMFQFVQQTDGSYKLEPLFKQ